MSTGQAEADHGPPQDPGQVRQQAAQEDEARVEPAPQPVARRSLRGEVDEGVRHSPILLQLARPPAAFGYAPRHAGPHLLLAATIALPAPASAAVLPQAPDRFAIPATDDGLPGAGPIRRYDWFQDLWRERRSEWAKQVEQDQHAVVFLGDSITQGWGGGLGAAFPGVKVANRGISGDTTRGVLLRLQEDVLALHPAAVVLLIGTNDLEEGAKPEVIEGNLRLIVAGLEQHDPSMPIILCQVFPSSATMKRPADEIKAVNALYRAAVKNDPRVTFLETWPLFAGPDGDATLAEFPDLLHPNEAGYAKWAAALRPVLATLGFVETDPDPFRPEEGFVSLFNGRDLTGWGYRPTSDADRANALRWQASDKDAAAWPFVTEKAVLRRPERDARRALRRPERPARRHDPAGVPEDPAAVDDAGVSRGLRPQARVPRHAERRQRRLRARPAAAVPRLPARRPLQGPEALPAPGLERDRGDRPRRGGRLHLQRRSARGRPRGAGHGTDRRRGRPRPDGVPPHPDPGPVSIGRVPCEEEADASS